ncbi:signal peptidase I [Gluconobacter morbifer G707]|uniref:Signal peptidase I n=1 Tax=Gluconobacter morbifer G707 TaxID=1088869 RepID=G6XK20_9PROT|nr:signal peptidase I [Gluconobacter morbifer G707]
MREIFLVPADRLFVMDDNSGDCQGSAADGGVGFLPLWNLQGQVQTVL